MTFEKMAELALEFARAHRLSSHEVHKLENLPDDDLGAIYLDADQEGEAIGAMEIDEPEALIDRGTRNWYQNLCRDAGDTMAVYGKGMFDYATYPASRTTSAIPGYCRRIMNSFWKSAGSAPIFH